MKLSKNRALFAMFALAAMLLLAAACAPAATPVPTAVPTNPPPPTAKPTSAPATAVPQPTTAPTAAPASGGAAAPTLPTSVGIQLAKNDQLGSFLADSQGRTLYLYTKDVPNTSNCYDACVQAWPILPSVGKPTLGTGVIEALVGTTTRKDGSAQVTYNGWPLYYWAKDKNPGDTTGQAVGKVWWVVSAEGNAIKPAGLQVSTNDKLGKFLADDAGRTVYMYTKDSKDTTVCYDKCEQSWPPLLSLGPNTLKDGVNASLVGSITRKDGSKQVTYAGWPLYYYAKDQAAGDTVGQGVGSVWYVIQPDGTITK